MNKETISKLNNMAQENRTARAEGGGKSAHRKEKKMIYTVFFKNEEEVPQDFATYGEAENYAEEIKAESGIGYVIESTSGEIV